MTNRVMEAKGKKSKRMEDDGIMTKICKHLHRLICKNFQKSKTISDLLPERSKERKKIGLE